MLAISVVCGFDLVPGKFSAGLRDTVEFGDFSVSSFAMGVGEGCAADGLKLTPGIIQETVSNAIWRPKEQ